MKCILRTLLTACLVCSAFTASADTIRILVYGDSNTWGWVPVEAGFPTERLSDDKRWAGVLETELQQESEQQVQVVVDGLVGRTTDLANGEDIGLVAAADFAGKSSLPEAIARHQPLDLVVIMLGTNDLQSGHQRPVAEIAESAFNLGEIVQASSGTVYSSYAAPGVLIVTPPPFGDTSKTGLSGLFASGEKPSYKLAPAFAAEAAERGMAVFDAGSVTATEGVDGVHLTVANHKQLGAGLVQPVLRLLSEKL